MNRFVVTVGLFVLGSMSALKAQQNDFATWNYCNLTYKLNENLKVCLSEHMIRNENATEAWLYFHDLSVNQWLTKNMSHELHVRYVQQKRLDNNFEGKELLYYALNGKMKLGDVNLNVRSRWQGLVYGEHLNDSYKGPYFYHRFRVSAGKSINYHWNVSSNVEFFQPLNRPKRSYIDQIRYGVMVSNRINKHVSIDHFFQIQQQKNRLNPYRYFVLGIGCNFAW
ncbi:MAG: DUF2490 domain-containing protein [Bacteroidetes bacterium]|nr:DUF2490 domain-containing protein [Bacteroidota bacterium]